MILVPIRKTELATDFVETFTPNRKNEKLPMLFQIRRELKLDFLPFVLLPHLAELTLNVLFSVENGNVSFPNGKLEAQAPHLLYPPIVVQREATINFYNQSPVIMSERLADVRSMRIVHKFASCFSPIFHVFLTNSLK